MEHDPVDYLVGKLQAGGYDPRPTGADQWKSRCPGHNGKSYNLSVKRGCDGTPLVNCHHADENGRNCTWNQVLRGLDVTTAELYGMGGDRSEQPPPNLSCETSRPRDRDTVPTIGRAAPICLPD